MPRVAPNSGVILDNVALSGIDRFLMPGPKYSTNLSTTPYFLSISVIVRIRSVAVTPSRKLPPFYTYYLWNRHIIGLTKHYCLSFNTAYPHPITPIPLTIGVWESVPIQVSGYTHRDDLLSSTTTTFARYSKFTWWHIPELGGTTLKLLNAFCAHLRSLLPLFISFIFHRNVFSEPIGCPKIVYLHRMVHNQINRDKGIDLLRIFTQIIHRIPHSSQIHHCRNSREILHQNTYRFIWYLYRAGIGLFPASDVKRSCSITIPSPQFLNIFSTSIFMEYGNFFISYPSLLSLLIS